MFGQFSRKVKEVSSESLDTYLLHEVLDEDSETLRVGFLRCLALHDALNELLEGLDVVEDGQGTEQKQVFLSQVGLVFLVDVAVVRLDGHHGCVAHEEGRLHEVKDVKAFHFFWRDNNLDYNFRVVCFNQD